MWFIGFYLGPLKWLTKDCILESHNGTLPWTGLRKRTMHLRNNVSSACHERGPSSLCPSPVSTCSDGGFVFILWNRRFCWAGQSSATDCPCLSQQHKGWMAPVVHGCWAIKHSTPSGGVFLFLLHSWHFRPCKEIKYFKDLTNFPRFCEAFFPSLWNLSASYATAL